MQEYMGKVLGRMAYVIALWCSGVSGLALAADPQFPDELSVGIVLPLTGDFAYLGEAIRKGVELQNEALRASNVRVIIEDDLFDRKAAVNAFRKLTATDQVQLVVSTTAPAVEPLLPLAESARVPIVANWDFNDRIHQPLKYSFSIGFSNAHAGVQLGKYACDTLKISTAAMVSALDEWGEVVSQNFKESFEKCGGKIVYQEAVNYDEDNLASFVTKLKALRPAGVFFPLYGASFSAFLRQLRAQRVDAILLTGEGMFPAEEATLGELAEGLYFQRIWVDNPDFTSLLTTRGIDSPALRGFMALGYDTAGFLQELQKAMPAGARTGALVQRTLETMSFDGLTGSVEMKNFIGKDLTILRYSNGSIQRP